MGKNKSLVGFINEKMSRVDSSNDPGIPDQFDTEDAADTAELPSIASVVLPTENTVKPPETNWERVSQMQTDINNQLNRLSDAIYCVRGLEQGFITSYPDNLLKPYRCVSIIVDQLNTMVGEIKTNN